MSNSRYWRCALGTIATSFITACAIYSTYTSVYPSTVVNHISQIDRCEKASFEPEPFEPDRSTDCRIPLVHRKDQLNKHQQMKLQSNESCRLGHFRDYFLDNGHMYGEGVWFSPEDKKTEVQYFPNLCRFANKTRNKLSFLDCLSRRNTTHIVISGDSTGRLTQLNMVGLFQDAFPNWKCRMIRTSKTGGKFNESVEEKYFAIPNLPEGMVKSQSCGFEFTCYSWQHECKLGGSRTIYIEYISMTHIVDIALVIKRKKYGVTIHDAANKLEFLLKYYFPFRGFPDIWIYKPPMRHETYASSVNETLIDSRYAIDTLKLYLPSTTSLIFLSDTRECPPQNSDKGYMKTWKKLSRLSRNEKIHNDNQAFFNMLQETVKPRNMFMFLDGMRITCSIMCLMHKDNAHYTGYFYQSLNRMIMESFCAEY